MVRISFKFALELSNICVFNYTKDRFGSKMDLFRGLRAKLFSILSFRNNNKYTKMLAVKRIALRSQWKV